MPKMEASVSSDRELVHKELLQGLRDMLNNPSYSDVVFRCKDAIEVHACRMLLVVRSPVFKSMLTNGMTESKLSLIPLPEISSAALLSVFEFLYTGAMSVHNLGDWADAFKVIGAARFFILPTLEELAWTYLAEGSARIADNEDVMEAATNLSLAMEFKLLCDSKESILDQLVTTLESSNLDPHYLSALSIEGFDYYMMRTKILKSEDTEDSEAPSIREYLRLRQICLWFACKISAEVAEKVSTLYLPDAMAVVVLLKDPQKLAHYRPPADASHYMESTLLQNVSATSFLGLLSTVDLRRIHFELLFKVVVPLQIFPATEIVAAFGAHALRPPRLAKPPVCRWENFGVSGTSVGDGSILQCTRNDLILFATGSTPIWPYGIYEWDMIFNNLDPESYYEVGFLSFESFEAGESRSRSRMISKSGWQEKLSSRNGGWAMRYNFPTGNYLKKRGEEDSVWKNYRKKTVWNDFRIRVHVNRVKRTCKFSNDNQDMGVAWRNLPDGVYFPAVTVHSRSTIGTVQIKLISGFDHDTW